MSTQPQNKGSILVVDDTADNLRLLSNILGDKGFEVRPVPSGRLALQAARRAAPDLVLLDITMPEMDGYEVCRQIKEDPKLRDVPVIFLTALSDTADKLKAFSVGGMDYISKPFQTDEVLARANAHIALRRAQKKLAENYERLRELEKVRDHLVQLIVHDMRSPLAVIMGNLEFTRMQIEDGHAPEASESLDAATRGLRQLANMTNDLLDVSKMEEGKMSLNLESCEVTALARDVAAGISILDPTRIITVEQGNPITISSDAGILRRILQNLLSNAVKHTPSGAAVRVTAIECGNMVRVSVIDRGPGVPISARQKIFEKFGAVEARADRKYHSVGLGLAFCKLAVEAHGGRIGVDSGEQGGSVFWFEMATRGA